VCTATLPARNQRHVLYWVDSIHTRTLISPHTLLPPGVLRDTQPPAGVLRDAMGVTRRDRQSGGRIGSIKHHCSSVRFIGILSKKNEEQRRNKSFPIIGFVFLTHRRYHPKVNPLKQREKRSTRRRGVLYFKGKGLSHF
jgi:hypothetical protein